MNEVLQKLLDTALMYRTFMQQDMGIAISDEEKYLAVHPTEELVFPFENGANIHNTGFTQIFENVKKSGKPYIDYVTKERSGTVAIKAIISPIYDGRKFIGYFTVLINNEKNANLEDISGELSTSIENSNKAMHNIADVSSKLNGMLQSMESLTEASKSNIEYGNRAIELIKGVATQSNMLGLNAAIEASRAGELGRGFSVVATEMRNLAIKSKETAEQVEDALSKVAESIEDIVRETKDAMELSNKQNSQGKEMAKEIDRITDKVEELVTESKHS